MLQGKRLFDLDFDRFNFERIDFEIIEVKKIDLCLVMIFLKRVEKN